MPSSYLTPDEAHTRLLAYGIDALPYDGALLAATRRVDMAGPFKGSRYQQDQPLAFPRTWQLPDDVEGEVPEAVLDWVALEAYGLSSDQSGGISPPISSISHSAAGSVTYATPKRSAESQLRMGSLSPYQRRSGTAI